MRYTVGTYKTSLITLKIRAALFPYCDYHRVHKMAKSIDLMTLAEGTKVSSTAGATVEVVDNPKDGVWVIGKYLTCPLDTSLVGSEDVFFPQDLVEILP